MKTYSGYTEQELVALLTQGDEAAYTEIYNRYEALVYTFTYKRTDDKEEARDIVHEVFLYLWEQRQSLHFTNGILPFIYTSVKNKILNRIKHKTVSARYLDAFQSYLEFNDNSADHLLRHKELAALIEKEIAALPTKMRQVFELSRNTNYTRKEIAAALEISEETVKSHMHHALKILKAKLGSLMLLVFM
ncbi:RNA polymerase sigma factor [Pedobacter deserti]|uniref:RNA polymerase sigma factor n=1 Tax=Pedobacter deserti TaxID=2817382 RepID=UPI002108AA1B|nr:RNA polymerase sigma-70 factor [Pedobacter sp. SYSU D00382]